MKHQPQYFADGKPLNFRKLVRCRADELDLLLEAARAAGFGMVSIESSHGLFAVRFQLVEAYNQNETKTQPCN